MEIQPLEDRVLVKPAEAVNVTPGGIQLPTEAAEKPLIGEVIEVGEGRFSRDGRRPMTVKKGDTVLFAKYGGVDIKMDGAEYKIFQEKELLGIVKENS